jgi:5-methylthioadenosine/S-adenosylhomocysteine deaminase
MIFQRLTPCQIDQVRTTRAIAARLLFYVLVGILGLTSAFAEQPFDPARGILLRGTVVTMDVAGTILHDGSVLVRNGKILATWQGADTPKGVQIDNAVVIDLGPKALIFPGLINLHNHPTFDMLELWPAPSSHVETSLGRPLGTEAYANRYQWNIIGSTSPPEYRRLVDNPQNLLNSTIGLGLYAEVGKYAEVKAMLGGETAFQGGPLDPRVDNILIRNVDDFNFGRDRIASWVPSIDTLNGSDLDSLLSQMRNGQVDAWLVHLAEGVRDSQRRPGDPFSSREEFATLASKGLLTDMTTIIHGNGLEPDDFVAMRAAPSIRFDGTGDGLGAKLVWSPLSNLLLYGQTALVYHALQAGVLISLGTDWSPSGSRNLLDELKVADITLRDPRLLGGDRHLIPSLSIEGKTKEERKNAEIALDKILVEMVTTNPATTLRWSQEVGSIEPGKFADLLVITKPKPRSAQDLPNSPYRNLIDATEEDVRLVLVNGEPLAGDVAIMATLKPGDYEVVTSALGCFQKAIDVTNPSVPKGMETFGQIEQSLRDSLKAMGGDNPPAGGGPADDSNTYSYLKAHIPGANVLTDAQFRQQLTFFFGLAPNGRLNIEGLQLSPVLVEDDDFYFHVLGAEVSPSTGLIADDTPPFGLYLSNLNQVQPLGNPFTTKTYQDRYFEPCTSESQ